MYKVKRFNKGEELHKAIQTSAGIVRTIATSTTYAIVDESGEVAVSPHPLTSKPTMQTFPRKASAQLQADWMNRS